MFNRFYVSIFSSFYSTLLFLFFPRFYPFVIIFSSDLAELIAPLSACWLANCKRPLNSGSVSVTEPAAPQSEYIV